MLGCDREILKKEGVSTAEEFVTSVQEGKGARGEGDGRTPRGLEEAKALNPSHSPAGSGDWKQ